MSRKLGANICCLVKISPDKGFPEMKTFRIPWAAWRDPGYLDIDFPDA
jgi:hypothetical protein